MAATLMWLMQAEGAGAGDIFATHPRPTIESNECRHSNTA
jgi:hypothetical protein